MVTVYPYTQKIIAEAVEKYKVYESYLEILTKKVDSFCNRKMEKKRLTRLISEELMRTHKERSRLLIVEHRNKGVERFSSRNAEEDYAEMDKIKETLKPSQQKIEELQEKILDLNIEGDRKTLLDSVEVAQSLFEEVEWSLTEATFYETAQEIETHVLTEEYYKLSSEERKRFMIPDPQKGGKDLEEWNKMSWKELALEKFVEFRKEYFEALQKYLEKQNEVETQK